MHRNDESVDFTFCGSYCHRIQITSVHFAAVNDGCAAVVMGECERKSSGLGMSVLRKLRLLTSPSHSGHQLLLQDIMDLHTAVAVTR